MTITFNSNIASLLAQRQLSNATRLFETSLIRLSSGSRINRPSDDAAGLGLSSALGTRARVYNQAVRNGNDVISMLNVAQGGLQEFSGILIRIKELAEQAANGSLSAVQRRALDAESTQLTKEYNRIAASSSFNGIGLFNPATSSVVAQLGFGIGATLNINTTSELEEERGIGSFNSVASGTIGGVISAGIAAGDFDGDGNQDLAKADTSLDARIEFGNGDGTFHAGISFGVIFPVNIAVADLNGDGRDDIILSASNRLYFFEGNSSRSVTARGFFSVGNSATTIKAGDIDGDGKVDLVVGGNTGTSVNIIKNNGNFSFTSQGTKTLGANVRNLELADITGDGKLDLVALATNSFLTTYDGSAGFAMADLSGFAFSNTLAAGDLNSDGIADLANGAGSVFLSNGNGTFSNASYSVGTAGGAFFAIADVNGDGYNDIARGPASGTEVSLGNGDGTFAAPVSSTPLGNYALLKDFNNDGILDLYTSNAGPGGSVFLANTAATVGLKRHSLLTVEEAKLALDAIDTVFEAVQAQLGRVGASMSRLEASIATLTSSRDGHIEASSRITDSDVASETANLARASILREVGSAVLAQANLAPQLALSLLQNLGK